MHCMHCLMEKTTVSKFHSERLHSRSKKPKKKQNTAYISISNLPQEDKEGTNRQEIISSVNLWRKKNLTSE